MKNILYILIAFLSISAATAQTDRSKAPKPAKAKKIQLGESQTFKLSNGLTVILVENHELPTISFSIQIALEPVLEGKVAGTASMAGQLLRTGTTTRSKSMIDKEIDFIGASLNTSQSGIYGSGLKKHQDKILELMADILYNPTFPAEEFDKLKKQTLSGLAMSASDPNSIAGVVAEVLRFGKTHPYGEPVTEETVNAITLEGVRQYYSSWFKPDVGYFIMVGDLTLAEGKALAEKYFSSWKPGKVEFGNYADPSPLPGNLVAFVDKPGAVQSVVIITNTVKLKPGEPDILPASLMNSILGGGVFSGRLMMNLREDKAYTYGASSSLRSDKYIGRFSAGAQVGTAVTDSAVNEFLHEMKRLQNELVTAEDLRMNKDVMAGEFARALESPSTLATFALNTIRYDLPKDYYATYLERLEKITIEDIQAMAKKYLRPDNCIILVVGNKAMAADKLARFAGNGTVTYFDRYGNPLETTALALPEGITAQTVINKYLEAIGGKRNLKGVQYFTMKATGKIEAMGRTMEIGISQWQAEGDKMCQEMRMGEMLLSKQTFDGTAGWIEGMGGSQEIPDAEIAKTREGAIIFPEILYGNSGYEVKINGIEPVEGNSCYRVEVKTPAGTVQTEYYEIASGLKIRVSSVVEMQGQTAETVTDLSDYRKVDGISFPFAMKQSVAGQIIDTRVDSIDIKTPVDPARFKK